jgi:hypothetical protein
MSKFDTVIFVTEAPPETKRLPHPIAIKIENVER